MSDAQTDNLTLTGGYCAVCYTHVCEAKDCHNQPCEHRDAAYEAYLAEGDDDMWDWVREAQAEAGTRTIDDYVRSLDKIDCPYCDGKGHNRAYPQQKCPKCAGKGYRVRNAVIPPAPDIQDEQRRANFDKRITDGLTDDELVELAKEQLAKLRQTQAEMSRRRKAAKPPTLAQCGHGARDAQGVYCDDPTCPRYVPF